MHYQKTHDGIMFHLMTSKTTPFTRRLKKKKYALFFCVSPLQTNNDSIMGVYRLELLSALKIKPNINKGQ